MTTNISIKAALLGFVSFLLLSLVLVSDAVAHSSCGFNSVNDYICPSPSAAPPGNPHQSGGSLPSTPPYTPGTPVFLPPGTPPACGYPSEPWSTAHSARAIQISQTDNATGGQCGKGVANILLGMGYPVTRGNGEDWDNMLSANPCWSRVSCSPGSCPPGTVLTYNANSPPGRSGGSKYGHVEIVTTDANGQRKYVSDAARNNWGGTVPGNFAGGFAYTCPPNPNC